MGTWSDAVLTTTTSLAKIESEINALTSAGSNTYLGEAVDIDDATDPITTGVSAVDVSDGKGTLEIWGIVNTTGAIVTGHSLAIKIYDCATEDGTFIEIDTGQRVYYRAIAATLTAADVLFKWVVPSHCEDWVKAVISSSASNSGLIDIYAVAKWTNKIELAKDLLGEDMERSLMNENLDRFIDYAAGEDLKDIVINPEIFLIACTYLTASLIYEDLANTDENSIFYKKSLNYRTKYKKQFNKSYILKNLDPDLDGDADIFKDKTPVVPLIKR